MNMLAGGGPPVGIDADLAETTWCAYAWPTSFGQSGRRTFFANQGGELIFTERDSYSGPSAGPVPGAAFRAPGSANSISGLLATGMTGRDGEFWRSVGN